VTPEATPRFSPLPAAPSSVVPASPTFSASSAEPPAASTEPKFVGSSSSIDRTRLPHSWREGCPVAVDDLRLLTVTYWGFDGQAHTGELVLHRDQAPKILSAMRRLYEERFPIERMELVDNYGGDDDRSGEANNTSAFNCREVEDSPGVWSQHAFGRAIDINPVQNPFIARSGEISPPSGAAYVDRSQRRPGMIHSQDPVVAAFRSVGWQWGGHWSASKDYQHFSSTGR
jgi:hypothetical protein